MTGGAARQRTVAPSRGSCGYRGVYDDQCSVNDSYCGVCDICCDWSDIFCHSSHSICHQYRRKTPQLTEHNGTRPAPCDEPVTEPEGSDHTPPSSWTTHQRFPFNERMSITSLSGHHTTSLLATTQATAATACPCLNIAAQGHERIITLAASSASIHGSIRETLATAHSIDWTGKAADHYRDRLLTIRNSLSTHDDEARSTAQIAHIAHVSTPQGGA